MSTESLINLSKTLGRKSRAYILGILCMKSCRNIEISKKLKIGREKVSEALKDLVDSRLVILFKRGAIFPEKQPIYVISPFGSEILNISDKLDSIKEEFSGEISNFGDGIEYILKYYLEADFKVNNDTIVTPAAFKIKMDIEKRTPCEKKNCEIICEPIIKNILKRFGRIDKFEKADHANCSLKITLIRKKLL